jgi:DNA (cytosine-5)-methyltransferase 1
MAGFEVPLAIDIDKDLTSSFGANFPATKLVLTDLSTADPLGLLRSAGLQPRRVDGVLGGPPCQGFSYMGKRDINDPRNSLVGSFFRFVRAAEPGFFLMENVPGILSERFRGTLDEGIDSLGTDYTVLPPFCVDAARYGAATSRERAIVFGSRKDCVGDLSERDVVNAGGRPATTVYNAIHDLPSIETAAMDESGQFWARYDRDPEQGSGGSYARVLRKPPPTRLGSADTRAAHRRRLVSGFQRTRHTAEVVRRFSRLPQGTTDPVSRCPRLLWNSPCPTIRAGTGKDRGSYQSIRPIHPEENRVITPREAGRIQGFPDWFQFHATIWHSFRMIGNSVCPLLVAVILTLVALRMLQ